MTNDARPTATEIKRICNTHAEAAFVFYSMDIDYVTDDEYLAAKQSLDKAEDDLQKMLDQLKEE